MTETMPTNIAIIGCGYVGTALADYWQHQGHHLTGTTTRTARVPELKQAVAEVILAKGDDADALHTVLKEQDTVVVSVAPTRAYTVDAAIYAATYLPLVENLYKALQACDRVKQVIYLSSCSIYGDRQGAWVNETSPILPGDTLIQVLNVAEQTVLAAAHPKRQVCIYRLGGIYGPGRELRERFAGLAGKTLPGKGDRIVNWIHQQDIVSAIDFARQQQFNGIYNLVDSSVMSIRDQIALACQTYDLPTVNWDTTRPSQARKSLRVSNQKLLAAGYTLIHPTLAL